VGSEHSSWRYVKRKCQLVSFSPGPRDRQSGNFTFRSSCPQARKNLAMGHGRGFLSLDRKSVSSVTVLNPVS